MDDWFWILIVVIAVIVVLGIIWWAVTRGRERRLEAKRTEAAELRNEAGTRMRRSEERQSLAEEQAEAARRERIEAETAAERAADVDPDIDRDR
jgi:flagellar biosynthesis/type III secretory pathway M-ring protein FliF/YscJ